MNYKEIDYKININYDEGAIEFFDQGTWKRGIRIPKKAIEDFIAVIRKNELSPKERGCYG